MNEISIFKKYIRLMNRVYLLKLKILCTITDMLMGIFCIFDSEKQSEVFHVLLNELHPT